LTFDDEDFPKRGKNENSENLQKLSVPTIDSNLTLTQRFSTKYSKDIKLDQINKNNLIP
jgi:hypothetical protein